MGYCFFWRLKNFSNLLNHTSAFVLSPLKGSGDLTLLASAALESELSESEVSAGWEVEWLPSGGGEDLFLDFLAFFFLGLGLEGSDSELESEGSPPGGFEPDAVGLGFGADVFAGGGGGGPVFIFP